MPKFFVAINTHLEANNLDDAFKQIGEYYLALAAGKDVPTPFTQGKASIRKIEPVKGERGPKNISGAFHL